MHKRKKMSKFSKLSKFEALRASDGARICEVQAHKVKINTRSDVYEFYHGTLIVAWVPKFSIIVRRTS